LISQDSPLYFIYKKYILDESINDNNNNQNVPSPIPYIAYKQFFSDMALNKVDQTNRKMQHKDRRNKKAL
jgi:hypothetical protein